MYHELSFYEPAASLRHACVLHNHDRFQNNAENIINTEIANKNEVADVDKIKNNNKTTVNDGNTQKALISAYLKPTAY